MTTALDIITGAFDNAGLLASETPLTTSEVTDGLKELNDMLASWEASGVRIAATPVELSSDEVRIPRGAVQHAKCQLAKQLLPIYKQTMPPELALKINDAHVLFSRAVSVIGPVAFPSTLPRGSGSEGCQDGWLDNKFFRHSKKENF